MRTIFTLRTVVLILLIAFAPLLAKSQSSCGTAYTLTPLTTCVANQSSHVGDLQNATSTAPTGNCGGATATTTYGVWYKFVATSPKATITLSGLGSNLTAASTYIELFSGACPPSTLTLISCQSASTATNATSLTVGATYYIRVYVTTSPTGNPGNRRGFTICLQSSPNDEPESATSLLIGSSCSNTSGTLSLAAVTGGLPAGCEMPGNHWDVWYKFSALSTASTITISSLGANFTNPEIQLYSGTPGALTSMQCGTTTLTNTSLTAGMTYYVRVSHVNASAPSGTVTFNICITYPPSNDECVNAIPLFSNTTCTNTAATLASATPSVSVPLGCAAAGTYYDVWFSFAAANSSETITISGMSGSGITTSALQLYSGTCGALTSVACGTTSIAATGLSVGATYYVRVSSVNAGATATGNFNICVTHPAPATTTIDFGKSYVNITKNAGGGTINPGDTLEVRATLVIKSGASGLDSLSFLDTLHMGGGVRLVPGSIALRTNEGKVYKSFTDAVSDDGGYFYTSGTDTIIRINFGTGASATARGRLLNTSKPSVFGSTCIIMATYQVVVYAGYSTTLNLGGGKITSRNISTGSLSDLSFSARNVMVYASPGLCANAVSASNAIGGDFNGTFGTGTSQNRGPSSNVLGYTYATFTNNAPADYYYGIANNTSAGGSGFTTITTWPKSDNSSPTHRVFNVWDISGDHTGASNPTKGNLPCDPSKPVSPTNPCGYMLVVNSAYKTDTAFQFTVSNLCPNTYYEISAWLKNICYKCGSDSNGVSATNPGTTYIPSALNDSSGVQPNLTFDINGVDYYTTGNIVYGGLFPSTQSGSDSNNTWVKRGFTYVTGSGQNSLTLTIRNNAPGGGGNDWAMDDIALATCLPTMKYSPSNNPTLCYGNVITISDTVRSIYDTYKHYKWQRSTNNGASWTDITAPAVGNPVFNGSEYQYITAITLPPSQTQLANNGEMYRVIVGTTPGTLSDANCNFTDGVATITLDVIDCGLVLNVKLLSFNAKADKNNVKLSWSTSQESEPVKFEIEKSIDGINFHQIGVVNGNNNYTASSNFYQFTDSAFTAQKTYYRVAMVMTNGKRVASHTIAVRNEKDEFALSNLINPFDRLLSFDVTTIIASKLEINLMDGSGHLVKSMSHPAYAGVNNIAMNDLNLAPGLYILQVKQNDQVINRKIIKK